MINGVLECIGCRRIFTVQRRIPNLLPRHLAAAQMQEMIARDDQVDEYDGNIPLTLFSMVEIPLVVHLLDINPTFTMLEAGCGTGRMTTRFAALVRHLISIDFSSKSLQQNEIKLQAAGIQNVDLIQADICHIPLKSELFDRAVSCQVLEHVPTHVLRERAVSEVARTVRPGNTVVVSGYQHSKWTNDKSGEHEGGIPYYRFTESEFRELLETSLSVMSISGILVYLYVAQCIRSTK